MLDITKSLLREREAHEERLRGLEHHIQELTVAMCQHEGSCPLCKNWHYPHCAAPCVSPEATCWTCANRMNEECGLHGQEVYEDTEACDEYSENED